MTLPLSSMYSDFLPCTNRSKNLVRMRSVVRNSTFWPLPLVASIFGTRSCATSGGWAASTPNGNLRSLGVESLSSKSVKTIPGESVCTFTCAVGCGRAWACVCCEPRSCPLGRVRLSGRLCAARRLVGLVPLHPVVELLDEGVGQLRQPALRRAVAGVARSAAALDAGADGVEDVRLDAALRSHELDGLEGAEEHTDQVDLDDCLDGLGGEGGEGTATAVDARVVDPVVYRPDLLLCELRESAHRLGRRDVGGAAVDAAEAAAVLLPQRHHGRLRVLDVADHHPVPARQELVRVGVADAASAAGDHDALRRRGLLLHGEA
mmetsp:Transcript_43678/g.144612  ORF Transcript_43678/g.144612 Transcript_43678/m.144612 type:complete len:320 (+) Transcript_43678:230-1189(+)